MFVTEFVTKGNSSRLGPKGIGSLDEQVAILLENLPNSSVHDIFIPDNQYRLDIK